VQIKFSPNHRKLKRKSFSVPFLFSLSGVQTSDILIKTKTFSLEMAKVNSLERGKLQDKIQEESSADNCQNVLLIVQRVLLPSSISCPNK
jgi:hypothetical protein